MFSWLSKEKKIGGGEKRRGDLLNQDRFDVKTYLPPLLVLGSRFSALSPNLLLFQMFLANLTLVLGVLNTPSEISFELKNLIIT